MTSPIRRAAAFALVGSLSLTVPLAERIDEPAVATIAAVAPFLLVAGFALTVNKSSIWFALFARPGDRRDGKLYGLAAFALAGAGIAIIAVGFGMPASIYVGTILLVGFGNLAGQIVRQLAGERVLATGGFVLGGAVAAVIGQLLTVELIGQTIGWQTGTFLAVSGALIAALLREVLFKRDDALVMVTVSLLLWLFASLPVTISTTRITVALAITLILGYLSYALKTASLAGMLTGVLLGLLTIVFGDYGWFLMLIAFFGIGGLSSKFRYDEKIARGIAEQNEGARGSGNVLANSFAALIAVLIAPASGELGISESVVFFAFAGAVAAALADTLSSEIGGLYDNPRLITTLRTVEPGTDGAITWQGTVAGVTGASIIAVIGIISITELSLSGGLIILAAGFIGMTVDSILGATIEGRVVGNQGVNFLATLSAALAGAAIATLVGIPVQPL